MSNEPAIIGLSSCKLGPFALRPPNSIGLLPMLGRCKIGRDHDLFGRAASEAICRSEQYCSLFEIAAASFAVCPLALSA